MFVLLSIISSAYKCILFSNTIGVQVGVQVTVIYYDYQLGHIKFKISFYEILEIFRIFDILDISRSDSSSVTADKS